MTTSTKDRVLLYGANGYTGRLIATLAHEYNLQPILAGRREEVIRPLALQLGLDYIIFDLGNAEVVRKALATVKVVIHAAGQFDGTAMPMVEACLHTGTHYLDINGDLAVFELLHKLDGKAKAAGIMILSGAGFDVVPTDCMALYLKKQLPDASAIKIAFATPGGNLSHGTALTTAQKLGEPGASRKNGQIVPEPVGKKGMVLNFKDFDTGKTQRLFVMSLPWGDVYTAYETTGIPDVESYTAVPKTMYTLLKFQGLYNWLLRTSLVRNLVKRNIDKRPPGLDDKQRQQSRTLIWARVVNPAGKTVTALQSGPDAYTITAHTSLLIARKVLAGEVKTGYQTPAGVYGENLILEIPGITRKIRV